MLARGTKTARPSSRVSGQRPAVSKCALGHGEDIGIILAWHATERAKWNLIMSAGFSVCAYKRKSYTLNRFLNNLPRTCLFFFRSWRHGPWGPAGAGEASRNSNLFEPPSVFGLLLDGLRAVSHARAAIRLASRPGREHSKMISCAAEKIGASAGEADHVPIGCGAPGVMRDGGPRPSVPRGGATFRDGGFGTAAPDLRIMARIRSFSSAETTSER